MPPALRPDLVLSAVPATPGTMGLGPFALVSFFCCWDFSSIPRRNNRPAPFLCLSLSLSLCLSLSLSCIAINYCTGGGNTCSGNATCIYTGPGTYNCSCKSGFSGSGQTCTGKKPSSSSFSSFWWSPFLSFLLSSFSLISHQLLLWRQ